MHETKYFFRSNIFPRLNYFLLQVGLDHPVRGDDRGGRARQPPVHHRVAVHEEVPQHRALSPHQPLNKVGTR